MERLDISTELMAKCLSLAREITSNATKSKKVVESIFRQVASQMKKRKGYKFLETLANAAGGAATVASWSALFKASPSLYGPALRASVAPNERAAASNCIMQVAGSLNAEAIVEYFSLRGLRIIFKHALPLLR